jgi:hypothetical protein
MTRLWLHMRIGDHVTEVDGRHIGRVETINGGLLNDRWAASAIATVKWFDSGWISEHEVGDLVRVSREESR